MNQEHLSVYHIITLVDWETALEDGQYEAASLRSEGFIHCSTREQVLATADRFYKGVSGLVLLEIDPARLAEDLRYDSVPNLGSFPHLYGPLNIDAVQQVFPFEPNQDGSFSWPELK